MCVYMILGVHVCKFTDGMTCPLCTPNLDLPSLLHDPFVLYLLKLKIGVAYIAGPTSSCHGNSLWDLPMSMLCFPSLSGLGKGLEY